MDQLTIEYMPLSLLAQRLSIGNPKDHDLGFLHGSMDNFGYTSPLLMDERTGALVAGHGRILALLQRQQAHQEPPSRIADRGDGEWMVPVIRGLSFDSPAQALAYLVADNQSVFAGGWDEPMLRDLLEELSRDEDGEGTLESTGFDENDLEALKASLVIKAQEIADAAGNEPSTVNAGDPSKPIKRLILAFDEERYNQIMARMGEIMALHGLKNHEALLDYLLQLYDGPRAASEGGEAL